MIITDLNFQDVEKNHVYLVHLQLDGHVEGGDLVHLVVAQNEKDAANAVARNALEEYPRLHGLTITVNALLVSEIFNEAALELFALVLQSLPKELREHVGYAVYAILQLDGFVQSLLEPHFAALKNLDAARVQLQKMSEGIEQGQRHVEEGKKLIEAAHATIEEIKSEASARAERRAPDSLPLLEWKDEGEEGWTATVCGWTLTARDRNWHIGREDVGIAAPRPNRASAAENRRAAEDKLASMGVRFVSTEKREP